MEKEKKDTDVESSESSLSSIDLNDNEYGYNTMINNIEEKIEEDNKIEDFLYEDAKQDYKIFYRGVNFMTDPPKHIDDNETFSEYSDEVIRKLKDKKNYKRRLCVKKHVDRTLGKTQKCDYKSRALDNYLHNNLTETVESFDEKFDNLKKFGIKNIRGYVHPAWYDKCVNELGNGYGNPLISVSKNAQRALYYTNLNKSNDKFNSSKHKCYGLLHIFVIHKTKFEELLQKGLVFDVDKLREERKINGPSAREGKNFEVIFKKKIDAVDYVGTIPYVLSLKKDTQKLSDDHEKIKEFYANMAERFAKSHIKKLEKERQENIRNFFMHYFQ